VAKTYTRLVTFQQLQTMTHFLEIKVGLRQTIFRKNLISALEDSERIRQQIFPDGNNPLYGICHGSICEINTVELLNKGHLWTMCFVLYPCIEVVLFLEFQKL
jgi:hypothetical protein